MKKLNFLAHFVILFVVTVLCGLIYASVQQAHRASANDPQLQIATDIKSAIEKNHSFSQWMANDSIDISQSLAVFSTLYDKKGDPIQSTGLLDGQYPRLPAGVFDFTKKNQEDVFSWQPRRNVRMAMVVEAVNSPSIGYVASGRSLREVEKRESNLTTMVVVAWIACLATILLHFLLSYLTHNKSK